MSTRIGRISQLDQPTFLRIQAGCNFVNAEVRRLRKQVTFVGVISTLLALFAYAILWKAGQRDPRLPVVAAVMLTVFAAGRANRELKQSYKGIVVRRVVAALGHGMTYRPESGFTRRDFVDMHLFDHEPDKFSSEDEICGQRNAVTYTLQEARATYEQGSGKHRRTVTIFRGVVIRLDFNKHFVGHTIVVSQAQSRVLGGLLGEAERRKGKEIVRLENADFNEQFAVYSTDQQQARYIITPKLMELIMEAQALLGADLKLSFHDNSVFVTVPQKKDRFEVKLFGGAVTPEDTVGELVEVVSLAERLVETLDLETRIWTRV